MSAADDLLHSLMIQHGIPPEEATIDNLIKLLQAYRLEAARQGNDRVAWREVTARISEFFPRAGKYKYGSQDHTDLKSASDQLLQALQQPPRKR